MSEDQVDSRNADAAAPRPRLDVSVVLAAWNEGGNIGPLITEITGQLTQLHLKFEVIVVDGASRDATREEAQAAGAAVFIQRRPGYGGALREGFLAASGDYILTLDADRSHPASLIPQLWLSRHSADVVIGSRFVTGGMSDAPLIRKAMSRLLNVLFAKLLWLPVKDSSSGYRLYRREVLNPRVYRYENFNILQEIIVQAIVDGYRTHEVPLHYYPRRAGSSHVALLRFCLSYCATICRMWVLRHSPQAADYEQHAFSSLHLLQRYWQRERCRLLLDALGHAQNLLDLGCGSSKFTALHPDAVALDIRVEKLRSLRPTNDRRVQATALRLPFAVGAFTHVVMSQLLPYVAQPEAVIKEVSRILPIGATLLITIPDHGRLSWRIIGFLYSHLLPNIARHPGLTKLSRYRLTELLALNGFRTAAYRYICGSELVLRAEKVAEVDSN